MLRTLLVSALCIWILVQCKEEPKRAGIEIQDAWIRLVPEPARTTAGYATIVNHGKENVLVAAESQISETIELHEIIESDGMMKMRIKQGGFPVGSHKTLHLKPGGDHLMFIGLKRPLQQNETIRVTLLWKNGERIESEFPVLLRKDRESEVHSHY